jgi:eukaryotic-like serine/threonine-protein kinase
MPHETPSQSAGPAPYRVLWDAAPWTGSHGEPRLHVGHLTTFARTRHPGQAVSTVPASPPRPAPTSPLLTVAARSIAAASGAALPDLLQERALRHYGEALRQYLAIRTGSLTRGARAFAQLLSHASDAPWSDDDVPARARLFRLAREVAERMGPPSGPTHLPWRAPRAPGLDAAALDALRAALSEEHAELLELRHARELPPDELAHVLDRPVERILEALGDAAGRAQGAVPACTVPLRDLLIEAFALEASRAPALMRAEERGLVPGDILGGRYAIHERVGTGAFGDVYRAQDTEVPGHVVALKLLHQPAWTEEARAAALRELHLIASVFHPSVVQFKDHGWHGDRLWFVMPWYEGETLEDRMARAPLDRGEARRIFEPLARALAAMHAAGIRHQDVKPDNIFLAKIPGFGGRNGHDQVLPVLLDLGVAAKEAEMVVAGTPTYFAPEVAAEFTHGSGRGPRVGPKADVFALALSLRNALEPRTQPDVPAGAVEAFIAERARTVPAMPEGRDLRFLEPTLRRWMSLDPDERPTADDLAEELAILTRPEERRRKLGATLRWAVPTALALAAIFGAVTFGLHTRAERQQMLAEQARRAQVGLQADLSVSKEQRRELEARVAQVRQQVQEGKWGRQRLAEELARARTQSDRTAEELAAVQARREKLAREVEERRRQLAEMEASLADSRRETAGVTKRAEQQARAAARLEAELADAQNRAGAIEAEAMALRTRVDAERAKSERLEREMTQALEARARAEIELRRLRQAQAAPERPAAEGSPDDVAGEG